MNKTSRRFSRIVIVAIWVSSQLTLTSMVFGEEKEAKTNLDSVQLRFSEPAGMRISWSPMANNVYKAESLVVPAFQDFPPGKLEFKLSKIPGRSGLELYPSVTIPKPNDKSREFLSESQIPIQFTNEDFDQVASGALVTKVFLLPDPEFRELAVAGVETLVSTRVDPGVDP